MQESVTFSVFNSSVRVFTPLRFSETASCVVESRQNEQRRESVSAAPLLRTVTSLNPGRGGEKQNGRQNAKSCCTRFTPQELCRTERLLTDALQKTFLPETDDL